MNSSDKSPPPLPPLMDAEGFRAATNVSRETLVQLELYADRLRHWQRRINLVGTGTIKDLWRRHFLDSAQLAPLLPEGAKTLTDIGSGAGFPGLVLAILTGMETHLVEADGRKAAFLREIGRAADISIHIHNERIEQLNPWPSDIVTARALAPLPQLLEYASKFASTPPDKATVYLFMKGRLHEEELTAAQKSWQMRNKTIRSVSDPSGRILQIWDIKKRTH